MGLFRLDHPEVLIFGVDLVTSSKVLNEFGGRMRAGETVIPGRLLALADWPHRIVLEVVPNPGEIVFGANDFFRRPQEWSVPVVQLSYDDVDGHLIPLRFCLVLVIGAARCVRTDSETCRIWIAPGSSKR